MAKDLTFPDASASSRNPPSARLRLPATIAPFVVKAIGQRAARRPSKRSAVSE